MRNDKRYGVSLLILMLLFGLLPSYALSAEISIKSDTIFRLFERDTSSKEDASVLPGYEYLQVDAGQLEDYGVSFHLYGWGRDDFANNDYYENQTAGELLYGYLEYRQEANRFNAKLGRFQTFEGVANDAVDGLAWAVTSATISIFRSMADSRELSIRSRAAAATASSAADWPITSARITRSASLTNRLTMIMTPQRRCSALTCRCSCPANLSLYGFSSYNNETDDWAEHSYELRIPVGSVLFKPYYQHFSYEGYFDTGANAVNPFRWLSQTGEELTAYGIDALWQIDDAWTLGGKAKFFNYDDLDNAETYSILVTWQGEGLTQYGGEIGHTAANDTANNDYTLVRLYGYCDAMADRFWIDFVSADCNDDLLRPGDLQRRQFLVLVSRHRQALPGRRPVGHTVGRLQPGPVFR